MHELTYQLCYGFSDSSALPLRHYEDCSGNNTAADYQASTHYGVPDCQLPKANHPDAGTNSNRDTAHDCSH